MAGKHKVVLVIEDDPAWQITLRRFLAKRGFIPILSERGEIGLDIAKVHRPALILLDMRLPDTNGIEVLRALRGHPRTKDIPVVLMTGLSEAADPLASAGRALGARYFFDKAAPLSELKDMMLRAIEAGPAEEPASELLERGRVKANARLRKVWIGGRPVRLAGPKRFDALCMLLRREGGVSKEVLLQTLWEGAGDLKTVEKTVERLRSDLESAGAEGCLLTIPGGYRLVG